jgi:hypothetical protein
MFEIWCPGLGAIVSGAGKSGHLAERGRGGDGQGVSGAAELPGLEERDVEVVFQNGVLMLRSELEGRWLSAIHV